MKKKFRIKKLFDIELECGDFDNLKDFWCAKYTLEDGHPYFEIHKSKVVAIDTLIYDMLVDWEFYNSEGPITKGAEKTREILNTYFEWCE